MFRHYIFQEVSASVRLFSFANARGVFADFRVDAPLDFRVDVRFELRLSFEREGVETTAVAVLAKLVKLPCRSQCASRIMFDHVWVIRTFLFSDDKNSRSAQVATRGCCILCSFERVPLACRHGDGRAIQYLYSTVHALCLFPSIAHWSKRLRMERVSLCFP